MRRPPAAAVTAEDADLFRAAIGPVRIIEPAPAAPAAPPPVACAAQRERDEREALTTSREQPFGLAGRLSGDPLLYRRDSVGERAWRTLRRGQFAIQDELDLHRMDAATAESALRRFLLECRRSDHLCVRVIHGKGLHSKANGPVLGNLVEGLLRRRADVLAYASAPPPMGGSGALLVLLSRRRPNEQSGVEGWPP